MVGIPVQLLLYVIQCFESSAVPDDVAACCGDHLPDAQCSHVAGCTLSSSFDDGDYAHIDLAAEYLYTFPSFPIVLSMVISNAIC